MKHKLIDSDKNLDDNDFLFVEKTIGRKIPKSLLELYKEYNGGVIDGGRNILIHPESGAEYEVKAFFPMRYAKYEKDSTVEKNYLFFCKKEKSIPEDFIPFAIDSGGFVFCMDSKDEKIYFFNFDNEGNSKELVANSLDEFMAALITESEAGF